MINVYYGLIQILTQCIILRRTNPAFFALFFTSTCLRAILGIWIPVCGTRWAFWMTDVRASPLWWTVPFYWWICVTLDNNGLAFITGLHNIVFIRISLVNLITDPLYNIVFIRISVVNLITDQLHNVIVWLSWCFVLCHPKLTHKWNNFKRFIANHTLWWLPLYMYTLQH